MPLYKKEINRLVEPSEIGEMVDRTYNIEHKVCLALLYLTGARPSELTELKKEDFLLIGNDLQVTLKTKKGGATRILPFSIETPFLKGIILPFIERLADGQSIFHFKSSERVKQIVYGASQGKLCPYNFRHNRLSRLGMMGASPHDLMYFKGAKDMKSISTYLYRNPMLLDKYKDKIK